MVRDDADVMLVCLVISQVDGQLDGHWKSSNIYLPDF